jgi:hypothetical protein
MGLGHQHHAEPVTLPTLNSEEANKEYAVGERGNALR